MAFIGKSTRITKSTRWIESAKKPKAISHAKRGVLLFKEDQEKAFYGDGAAR
jgi:hypothetical protein